MSDAKCDWTVGPIWKLDGEVCVCSLPPDHVAEHICSCGSWYSNCGRASDQPHPSATNLKGPNE